MCIMGSERNKQDTMRGAQNRAGAVHMYIYIIHIAKVVVKFYRDL